MEERKWYLLSVVSFTLALFGWLSYILSIIIHNQMFPRLIISIDFPPPPAYAGLVLVITTFIIPLLFWLISAYTGLKSLNDIRKNSSKFKGEWSSILGFILSALGITACLSDMLNGSISAELISNISLSTYKLITLSTLCVF
jgi:hypothetical protein